MKRVMIWIDCEDEKLESTRHQIENFLESLGVVYRVVEVCELVSLSTHEK